MTDDDLRAPDEAQPEAPAASDEPAPVPEPEPKPDDRVAEATY